MPITTTCPGCKARFRLPEELAGKQVRCQKCAQMFTVPMALAGLSAPAIAAPEEAPIPAAADTPPPQDDVILAALAPDEPPAEEVILAPLAEPKAAAKPAPAERPVSLAWTMALLAFFLVAMLTTSAFASIWVATHLSPPLRVTALPPLNVKQDFPFDQERKDERVFIDKARDRDWDFKDKDRAFKEFGPQVTPEPIAFGFDGKASVNSRTQTPPGFDHGKWDRQGPYRLYRIRLTKGVTYNFLLNSPGLQGRLRITDGDLVIRDSQAVFPATRVMFSHQPQDSRDYLVWVNLQFVPGNFDLSIMPESRPQTIPIDLTANANYLDRNGALRLQDPLDSTRSGFGPFREYEVTLEANKDYEFRVSSPMFLPVLILEADKKPTTVLADAKTRSINHSIRVPAEAKYRVRVTSQQCALGMFNLQILPKAKDHRIIAPFNQNGKYEDAQDITTDDSKDPIGSFKTYHVELEAGKNYVFDMKSDTFMTRMVLFDSNNKRMPTNVVKNGKHSQMTFKAANSGSYRILAGTLRAERGNYTFTIERQPNIADEK